VLEPDPNRISLDDSKPLGGEDVSFAAASRWRILFYVGFTELKPWYVCAGT